MLGSGGVAVLEAASVGADKGQFEGIMPLNWPLALCPGRIRTCDTRFGSGVESLPGGASRYLGMLFGLISALRRRA
ncbi:uncharacterized protein SAZU_7620 [Streptomyces azureus]|uniref:Uncharacterized protein n=1 Tax=Streptomyces azureus TaxID=146537 RepID=A0A0K8PY55_STRAJ|nr:uncharacterized protein SAZU_7620 [Streptomyces azureus]